MQAYFTATLRRQATPDAKNNNNGNNAQKIELWEGKKISFVRVQKNSKKQMAKGCIARQLLQTPINIIAITLWCAKGNYLLHGNEF